MRINIDYEKYTDEELKNIGMEIAEAIEKRTKAKKATALKNIINELEKFMTEFPCEYIIEDLDWGPHDAIDLIDEIKRYNDITE